MPVSVNPAPQVDDDDDWLDSSAAFAVPEGWYEARTELPEDRTGGYGPCIRWLFTPRLDPSLGAPEGFTVSRITSRKFTNGPKGPSKAYEFITAILGGTADRIPSRGDLVGRTVRLKLGVNENGYNEILRILPAKATPAPKPVPAAKAAPVVVSDDDDEWTGDQVDEF